MTKVKLKLMFFFLNSLLTADVLQARPYSENATDIVIKFSNSNNTFNIPVDTESDTLVVADDDGSDAVKEDTHDLASLMENEQDRDENMAEIQHSSIEEALDVEKKLNISNPSLQEMIDSETDRDDTLTDLMFRPEVDFAEMPRFEFLIAGRINESEVNRTGGVRDGVERMDRNASDVLRKVDYVELVEVDKPRSAENKSAYMANITGHDVDNDVAPDTS
jgi:hypothetical protein